MARSSRVRYSSRLRNAVSLCSSMLAVSLLAAGQAGAQPATPASPGGPGAASDKVVGAPPAAVVAGIPVNYDEAKVGSYMLADPLTLADGEPVRDAKTWYARRRPELVRLFATQQYGVAPGRPAGEWFEVTDKGTPALGGKAIRKQVTIHLAQASDDPNYPEIHLLEYLPANATGPVPMFFTIGFGAIQNAVADPGIAPERVRDPHTNHLIAAPADARSTGRIDVDAMLDAGIGVATYYYAELDPDSLTGFAEGIRARYAKPGEDTNQTRPADAWGSVAAWAWGMSRVEDYFETDPAVDARRVAIHGVSRLGKTVTWAGALDTRFAAVIASCGGEGGAALSHRDYGETIAHLTAPTRYAFQFARNYGQYAGFPDRAPFDSHLLLALIAPRPLLLQTGSTDYWSDPKGEFLAEVAAGPVYRLLGAQDLGTTTWPAANTPLFSDGLNYFMHDGPHGMVASDWAIYVRFLKANLHPER